MYKNPSSDIAVGSGCILITVAIGFSIVTESKCATEFGKPCKCTAREKKDTIHRNRVNILLLMHLCSIVTDGIDESFS